MSNIHTFTKTSLTEKKTVPYKNGTFKDIDVYIPSDKLVETVQLALHLWKRPLLLMGEPGCGKTRLAEAVAYALHGDKMYKHFFQWNIKSTTKAKDGIYQYDALKRLYHVNMSTHESFKGKFDVENMKNYITEGELYKAFFTEQNGEQPNILLIDEIDKADKDFPNDLLLEIEKREFYIPELGDEGKKQATSKVLIFITSNRERELPTAFLRRCLYYYIHFPKTEVLTDIVLKHFYPNAVENKETKKIVVDEETQNLVDNAIKVFEKVREELGEYEKKPTTSELLDWFEMIKYYTELKKKNSDLSKLSTDEQSLIQQLDLLDTQKVPFIPILFKTYETFINANTGE